MQLTKYSFGAGDRFGLQGDAQLEAIRKAAAEGIDLAIVWNKSSREHGIVGTSQKDVRREAEAAIAAAGWRGNYFVDADHINLDNVGSFVDHSDFFTIDVADYIGEREGAKEVDHFVGRFASYLGELRVAGIDAPWLLPKIH